MKRRHVYIAGAAIAGALLVWWWRRSKTPPAVAGVVTSGSQSATFDTNVLSPTFGLPIQPS